MVKTWNDQSLANHGRGTPCRPFSPPVTSVHLKAISKAICENASVSSEKYRPRRRRMISAIAAASSSENTTANDQRLDLVADRAAHGDRRGIGGAAEEHRRAERHQAGVADQQVHAGAVQHVDGDLGDQADRRADRLPQRGQREQHEDDPQDRVTQQRSLEALPPFAEQAARAQQQHQCHEQVHHRAGRFRFELDGQRDDDADQQPGDDRAGERTQGRRSRPRRRPA